MGRAGQREPVLGPVVVLGLLLALAVLSSCLPVAAAQSEDRDTRPVGLEGQAPRAYRYFVPMYFQPPPNKFGIAGGSPAQVARMGGSWLYDWTANPPVGDEFFESVPMLGGWFDPEKTCPVLGGNSVWLLGANECDLANQCNTPAEVYAAVWRKIEECYPNRLLVAPAPSDTGRYWLVELRLAYRARYGEWPRFDALAMHCYRWTAAGCEPVLRDFLTWVEDWDVPDGLWVTEFSYVEAWADDPEREARTFVARLEAEPMVTHYAVFTSFAELGSWYWPGTRPEEDPSLFEQDGVTLTEVGTWYVKERPER